VHLAEPAETAGLRGPKKRAKGDRADARHLRELLMIKRLPESWIPPDHILDLRARVRLRHTLSEQRSEWQQRIQAVLYHHGCPQRRSLMTQEGRAWLQAQPLPSTAREQVTVAIAMIDALEVQITPVDKELRAYARRAAGR
jgi:transposase